MSDRAKVAPRPPGQTDPRAQLHERLVEFTGRATGHELPRQRSDRAVKRRRADALADAREARQDTLDVAIDRGNTLAERDARDGPGGVRPDAGEFLPLGRGRWKPAAALARDEAGRAVQVAGAGVVAQPGP
jgi:hypothetical protein